MITNDKIAVWMDHGEWAMDFFDWLTKNKLNKTFRFTTYAK